MNKVTNKLLIVARVSTNRYYAEDSNQNKYLLWEGEFSKPVQKLQAVFSYLCMNQYVLFPTSTDQLSMVVFKKSSQSGRQQLQTNKLLVCSLPKGCKSIVGSLQIQSSLFCIGIIHSLITNIIEPYLIELSLACFSEQLNEELSQLLIENIKESNIYVGIFGEAYLIMDSYKQEKVHKGAYHRMKACQILGIVGKVLRAIFHLQGKDKKTFLALFVDALIQQQLNFKECNLILTEIKHRKQFVATKRKSETNFSAHYWTRPACYLKTRTRTLNQYNTAEAFQNRQDSYKYRTQQISWPCKLNRSLHKSNKRNSFSYGVFRESRLMIKSKKRKSINPKDSLHSVDSQSKRTLGFSIKKSVTSQKTEMLPYKQHTSSNAQQILDIKKKLSYGNKEKQTNEAERKVVVVNQAKLVLSREINKRQNKSYTDYTKKIMELVNKNYINEQVQQKMHHELMPRQSVESCQENTLNTFVNQKQQKEKQNGSNQPNQISNRKQPKQKIAKKPVFPPSNPPKKDQPVESSNKEIHQSIDGSLEEIKLQPIKEKKTNKQRSKARYFEVSESQQQSQKQERKLLDQKQLGKEIKQNLEIINFIGQSVAKCSALAPKLNKLKTLKWFPGIFFLYKRFYHERILIRDSIIRKIPNRLIKKSKLSRIAPQSWQRWFQSKQCKAILSQIEKENIQVLQSLVKMEQKLQKKYGKDPLVKKYGSVKELTKQQSEVTIELVVGEFDELDENGMLQDEQILSHITTLIYSLEIIAELDGKMLLNEESQFLGVEQYLQRKSQIKDLVIITDKLYSLYQQ